MTRDLWTIGHGTSTQADFLATLHAADIDLIADVRAHPGSRRNPQFSRDTMPTWLVDAGIAYRHLEALGGRRPRNPDVDPTTNGAWQNQSFHNYADYALTDDFTTGLAELRNLSDDHRVAVMCSESVPWRCHRLLISNAIVARGDRVWHLIGDADPKPHALGQWGATPVLHNDDTITYPAS
ncbi:MAG TPA: DUF488 domain-containing protein [Tessaracoccus flavescens]|uniref:DUF488 domain-containing protein n=1 Tax=Tessaracoccus flavescens TaxID=399497 RepID=A0A921ENW4_9ACTN|nr:DUF488 domain-containing protein [Tessaracoccus flavescens]